MKNREKNMALVLAGVLIGCAVSGPAAYAAEEWYKAYSSGRNFYIDGEQVEMDAYAVEGNNYVKLRDVGRLIGFNVWWDEENSTVQIETDKPYTGEAPATATQDAEASPALTEDMNPAVLAGAYTREAYEALRRTVTTGEESAPVAMTEETRTAMLDACAAIGGRPGYHMKTAEDGKTSFYAKRSGSYEEAAAYCKPFIDGLTGTDAEGVRSIAYYVCDRLTYASGVTVTPRTALTDDAVHCGNCMSYAHCFKFLCDMVGIPCILVHSDTHQWNEVYVDGTWSSVDVSSVDVGDDLAWRGKAPILHREMQGADYVQSQPELTSFARELLVPGSTK